MAASLTIRGTDIDHGLLHGTTNYAEEGVYVKRVMS